LLSENMNERCSIATICAAANEMRSSQDHHRHIRAPTTTLMPHHAHFFTQLAVMEEEPYISRRHVKFRSRKSAGLSILFRRLHLSSSPQFHPKPAITRNPSPGRGVWKKHERIGDGRRCSSNKPASARDGSCRAPLVSAERLIPFTLSHGEP